MKPIKLLAIGIIANMIENIILLLFFGVKIGKQTLIGAGVFAFITILIYKVLQNGQKDK